MANTRKYLLNEQRSGKKKYGQAVVAHAFHLSTWEVEAGDLYEFGVSIVYSASSRTARERNPVSEKDKSKKGKGEGEKVKGMKKGKGKCPFPSL